MSQALYRRYRPETFAEVIGQEHVTGPLTAALTKDRINHAYLFSGPRGCGKTTSARILARCLNCAQGPTATPCGECDSCRDLARGGPGSLDVVEIDAASHGGVDDARSLRERAAFAPARDRYKVFIIDEAHMVSPQGFNALLKIVEEPPPHVRFVFATTEPDKVIGTIRSRTHHYPFRLVPPERLQTYLAQLCEQEGVAVGQGVLPLVVRAGGGSVRDSLSVLDQLIGGAGSDGLSYPMAVSLLGYTDSTLLDDVVDALAAGDGATVFGVVDRVVESGHDPRRFVEDVLERLRDLVVVAAVPDGAHAVLRALPADQLDRMRGQAARFGRAELSRAADVVNAALTEMTRATSPRLQLELLCARLLLPGADDTERGLYARLDRLERRLGAAGMGAGPIPTTVDVAPSGPPTTAPVTASPASPGGTAPAPSVGQTGQAGPEGAGRFSAGAAGRPAGQPGSADRAGRVEAPEGTQVRVGSARPGVGGPDLQAGGPPTAPGGPGCGAPAGGGPTQARSPGQSGGGAGGLDIAMIRRMWPEVMASLAGRKRTTWSLVSQYAQVLDFNGEWLLLGFDSEGRAGSFTKGPHAEVLRQVLIDVVGLDCRLEAVGTDRPAAAVSRRPPSAGSAASSAGSAASSAGSAASSAGSAASSAGSAAPSGRSAPAGPRPSGSSGPSAAGPAPDGPRPGTGPGGPPLGSGGSGPSGRPGPAAPGASTGPVAPGASTGPAAQDNSWPEPARPPVRGRSTSSPDGAPDQSGPPAADAAVGVSPGRSGPGPTQPGPTQPGAGSRSAQPRSGQGSSGPRDQGGRTDAGRTDAGRTDAGRTDAGRTDAGRTGAGRNGAGRSLVSPYVDVPPPDEPLPDDEPPYEEGPPPDAWGPTSTTRSAPGAGPVSTSPPRGGGEAVSVAGSGGPTGRLGGQAPDLGRGAAPTAPAGGVSGTPSQIDLRDPRKAAPSRGRDRVVAAAAADALGRAGGPGPRLRPIDDEPSADDPDIEGSNLVGAVVVEQILGGRLIEERED